MTPKVLAATQSRVECELHENHPLRLVGAKGRRVQCLEGVVWLTAYNLPTDIFLRAGGSWEIPNGGLVLVEAIGTCRVRVDLPRSFDYDRYRLLVPTAVMRMLRGVKTTLSRRLAARGV